MTQQKVFLRPEVKDVYKILKKHLALIVHFSGAPKGYGVTGDNHYFPDDLLHVINLKAMGGVSCSVILPGDKFHGSDGRNAIGTIGVILGLENSASVADANCSDCGSFVDKEGNRISENDHDISTDELIKTIIERPAESYNEWIIKNYKVLGVFTKPPIEISKLVVLKYPPDMPEYLKNDDPLPNIVTITPNDFPEKFRKLPIYTFDNGTLQLICDDKLISVEHERIYSLPS